MWLQNINMQFYTIHTLNTIVAYDYYLKGRQNVWKIIKTLILNLISHEHGPPKF